jgi:hypothetical protein
MTGEPIAGDPQHSGSVGYALDKVGNRESRASTVADLGTVTGVSSSGRRWAASRWFTGWMGFIGGLSSILRSRVRVNRHEK